MYKAIQEIGGYKVGDEVPEEMAEIWLKMYSVPPVEKTDGKLSKKEKKVVAEENSSNDVMLEDYLGRNTNVVRSNIEEDNLSKDQLKKLLVIEKSNKSRSLIVKAIKRKLNKIGG